MTTTERTYALPETTKPTTIEAVTFRDGMIVTADDLDAAQRYPKSLLLTVFRAYFGCGVVCGLGLGVKHIEDLPSWVVCVDRGVAIDCHGYPIELCKAVKLDLSPDPCACEPPPVKVYIAVRRATSDEAPHDACTCDLDEPQFDCRRVRDYVVVKAFTEAELDALGDRVCRRPAGDKTAGDKTAGDKTAGDEYPVCTALTACSACACGECWILLGWVTLDEHKGIVGEPDTSGRRWVKPIEALCPTLVTQIAELKETVARLCRPPTELSDELSTLKERVAALERPKQPPAKR